MAQSVTPNDIARLGFIRVPALNVKVNLEYLSSLGCIVGYRSFTSIMLWA
jgi:hypothetical protein